MEIAALLYRELVYCTLWLYEDADDMMLVMASAGAPMATAPTTESFHLSRAEAGR